MFEFFIIIFIIILLYCIYPKSPHKLDITYYHPIIYNIYQKIIDNKYFIDADMLINQLVIENNYLNKFKPYDNYNDRKLEIYKNVRLQTIINYLKKYE